jgi:hydrogenase expression/formation protein HypC
MCLAIPMKIESIDGAKAVVSAAGAKSDISISFVDGAAVGDYVLVHAGFAIKKIDEREAEETVSLLNKMAELAKEER